jgi:hypothetical protein
MGMKKFAKIFAENYEKNKKEFEEDTKSLHEFPQWKKNIIYK